MFDAAPSRKFKTIARFDISGLSNPNGRTSNSIQTVDIRSYLNVTEKLSFLASAERRKDSVRRPELAENSWFRISGGARYFAADRIALTGEFGIKLNHNLRENGEKSDIPASETRTSSCFVISGTDIFWKKWFDTVLQYKRVWTTGSVENSRHSLVTELGFEIYKGIRFYAGNEFVIYSGGEFLEGVDNDYRADKIYFRIMKKF
jgi:hypothetical protein